METEKKSSFSRLMRVLHRDIGFFVIGLVLVYSLSGIILIFRNYQFMQHSVIVEKIFAPNLDSEGLGKELHARDFKIIKTEGEIVYFKDGQYSKSTGNAIFSTQELIFPFDKFSDLHTASAKSFRGIFAGVFGVALLFLAISSYWMYKPKTKLFRRGVYLSLIGVVFTIILLFL